MWLKLPSTYVDAATQVPMPDAIVVITDANFNLRGGNVILVCSVFPSPAAYLAGRTPASEASLALSQGEIASQAPALLGGCYTIVKARPDYAGATLVIT